MTQKASVDWVASAVNIICKDTKLDVLTFGITREQGMDQYDQDLFAIVESIKNSYVVDVMYSHMNEAIFKPPIVVIFSNKPFLNVKKYLSLNFSQNIKIVRNEKIFLLLLDYESIDYQDN